MAAKDFRTDIDLGEVLNIPKIGGEDSESGDPVEASAFDAFTAVTQITETGLEVANQIFAFQEAQATADIKTAERQIEYWTKFSQQNRENYRAYDQQLDSWYRASDYVENFRQYQSKLQEQRAEFKGEVSTAATQNFARQLADIEGRFYEEEAKDEIQINAIMLDKFARASKKAATGQVGRTVTRINNQYNQQYLQNLGNRQITREFRLADKLRMGEAANVARQNTVNKIQFYTPQPIADPVKPLAPLPIRVVEPLATPGPSKSALAIGIGKTVLSGIMDYKASLPEAGSTEYDEKPPASTGTES
jgi:hypothetical protein